MELMPLAQGVLVPPGVEDPYDYELLGYHSSETNQFAFTALCAAAEGHRRHLAEAAEDAEVAA